MSSSSFCLSSNLSFLSGKGGTRIPSGVLYVCDLSEIFAFSKYASSPVDGGVIAYTSSVERSKSISSIFNGSSHGDSSVSEVGLAPK